MTSHLQSVSPGSSFSQLLSQPPSDSSPPAPTSSTTSSLAFEPAGHAEATIVGRLLIQLEDQIDAALATSSLLNAALVDARRGRGLSAVVGQPIFRKAAGITAGVSQIRGETVDMHRLLDTLGKRLNIPVQAYGDDRDKVGG